MSDWTPTTEQVRDGYRYDPEYDYYHPLEAGANVELRGLAFDRWLSQVKAEAWCEGKRASDTAWEHIYYGHPVPEGEICPECSTGNPYRQEKK